MLILDRLELFPRLLSSRFGTLSDAALRVKPAAGGFALVEQVWHLADLEFEGYGKRIDRLLTEVDSAWPDFDGDAVAQARRYIELPLQPGLERFAAARAENVRRLRAAKASDWAQSGIQEKVGRVTLARVVEMMAQHDAGHAVEITALLRQLHLDIPAELEAYEPPLEQSA